MSTVNAVGFDFGTTRSKAAVVDQTERPFSVQNSRGDFWTPSAIFFEKGKPTLIGVDAMNEGFVKPQDFVCNFKLKLGTNDILYRGLQDYTATDLASIMLGELKKDAERRTNTVVSEAVFSCPANFRDDAKQALLEACRTAGIEPLGLISEPAAAGLAYAFSKGYDQTFAVVDLGGGTLDVSLMEVTGNTITVKATDGVAKLGGNDFTDVIERHVLEQFGKQAGYMPSIQADPLFFQELRQKAEAAKVTLSDREKTNIVIGCRGKQAILEIKRADFVSWCKPLFDQAIDCADKAIRGAGVAWRDVGSLIMVGGASRMPHLQQKLADLTGLVPKMDLEPDRVVAMGAALKARLILGEKGVLPHPNIFVKEVTAHGLGCAVLKPGGRDEADLIQSVIIPKNTPVPSQRTDHFFLEHESQDSVTIVVAQGEESQPLKQCLKIGELRLDNLPKESKRSKRIKVDFAIDPNGMAYVTATDVVGQATKSVSVNYKK